MKAIFIECYGNAGVLQYGELSRPVPKPGQVLVEVHAASVNPRDWLLREGRYVTTIPSARAVAESVISRLSRFLSGGRRPSAHVVLVQASGKQLERIAALMEQRRIRSIIDTVYPLHDAREAHEKSRNWRTRGKLVLSVRTDDQHGVREDAPQAMRL